MKIKYFIFPVLILFLWTGCRNSSVPQIEIIARVDDQYLTRDELINWMPPDLPEEQKEILSRQYIDRWIKNSMMASLAKN